MVTHMSPSRPSLREIWDWLDGVNDPEIPVISVVDLGIVRDVRWQENGKAFVLVIKVTPTYSGCPANAVIKEDILKALQLHRIDRAKVETQLSPAWTTDWISERGRRRLREYGIVPPITMATASSMAESPLPCVAKSSVEDPVVPCPRCASPDTRMISRFGSTPCKAFYVCRGCGEPFDYFKCH
jgi:ring-1,2-phenylacetyl-CoA epoxidase subunit PaaD